MQFGVFDHLDDSGLRRGEQLEQRLALIEQYDRDGFYAYHLAEHHGTPLGIVGSPNLFLAAAAQRTSRIRLGPLVNVLPLYHPIRLVEEWCLLDHMSGGRLEPGIGRGASPIEASFFGIEADSTPARFEEAVEVILRALMGGVVTHHGRYITVNEMPMTARPLQTPRPPFWFGASRPDRAPWCAEHGINVMSLVTAERTRITSDAFRERWQALGRRADELPFCGVNRHMVLADTEAQALRVAERVYPRFKDSLDHLWKRRNMPVPPIYPASWRELQELGNGFAGTPEGARQYVRDQIEKAGINYMTIDMAFGGVTLEEASRTASLFANEVMPEFMQAGVGS
ncbi:MAG TPA: LLM class flavin-dependent oxidoreductase [Solirubrobacteraceae bacterium]|nr:LLM class flavin-dependent oxidoreductase [Solirubrobacteraceae bacterium]